jgi:hypothetical protein
MQCCLVEPIYSGSSKVQFSGEAELTIYHKAWKQCKNETDKFRDEFVFIDGKDNLMRFNLCEKHLPKQEKEENKK